MLLVIVLQVGFFLEGGLFDKIGFNIHKESGGDFFFLYREFSLVVQLYVPLCRLLYF